MIEIITIGGYNEVGKNQTAIKLGKNGEDVLILDSGLFLPAVIEMQEAENFSHDKVNDKLMREIGAIPDDSILDKMGLRNKVRAMLIGHAHLDHVGAVQWQSKRYPKADVVGTPFTIEVLKQLLSDNDTRIPNKMKIVNPNSKYTVKGKNTTYEVEFLNMTHSTPQTALMVIHTREGAIVYSNDYKLDNHPILGDGPNYKAMERLRKSGVKVLIIDSLYSSAEQKTPSEKVARDLLEEVLLTINNKKNGIIVTTFSSHIARLKSIVEFATKLNREVLFVGRSLRKYTQASINAKICTFKNKIKMASYKNQVESFLRKATRDKQKYLVVCTGHQGEPGSILDRIARQKLPYKFNKGDHVVFSSKTIPVPINISNKNQMDKRLKKESVRIFDNVHVSGHGGREDARDLIELLQPEHLIPSHGEMQKLIPMMELGKELGYKVGKTCHLMENGKSLKLR
jgi:ribonuclease J